jgi:hypothetical protein
MRLAAGMEWSPAYAAIRELLDLPRQAHGGTERL